MTFWRPTILIFCPKMRDEMVRILQKNIDKVQVNPDSSERDQRFLKEARKVLCHLKECKRNSCQLCAKVRVARMITCTTAAYDNEKEAARALLSMCDAHPPKQTMDSKMLPKVAKVRKRTIPQLTIPQERKVCDNVDQHLRGNSSSGIIVKHCHYPTSKPKRQCLHCGGIYTIKKNGELAGHLCCSNSSFGR